MKVYTKTGDSGETSLYDGSRAKKYSINFEVLGEIDELSARIGMLCALIVENDCIYTLRKIQSILQDINSHIATIDKKNKKLPIIKQCIVDDLEMNIDIMEEKNPKLTRFILPGVCMTDAQAQLCRTQARKVERCMVKLHNSNEIIKGNKGKEEINIHLSDFEVDEVILKYMNRLSDYFFVLARWLCSINDIKDVFYIQE